MSGKETIKAELPVPDCYEGRIRQVHEEKVSMQQIQAETESGDQESDSQSEKTEIVGYHISTGRYALRTAGEISPIAYYSGRKSTTALCTAMAETIALAKLVVKIKHLRALMHDLQVRQNQETPIESTIVWVDNTAALAVATGSDFTHETVKHVTVKVRFIQECVQRKIVRISYVATQEHFSHDD